MQPSALAHDPAPRPSFDLATLVKWADITFDASEHNYLFRLGREPSDMAIVPLPGHPLDELLGFLAPPDWLAVGLHCLGRAHQLDDTFDLHSQGYSLVPASGDDGPAPIDVRFTIAVDRFGNGAGLMRHGATTTQLSGLPDGLLGDVCRRALRLPTTSPPGSTAELWLRVWIDRIVESICFDNRGRGQPRTFAELTALHPAALGTTRVPAAEALLATSHPPDVAEATELVAEEWPWSRLRRDPAVVETEGPPLRRDLALWMDDGMFARWLLADVPPLGLLLDTVAQLLPPPLFDDVGATLAAAIPLQIRRPQAG
jgi:hypothetical protein